MSNTKSAESTLSEPIFNRQALVRLILPLLAEQFLSVSMGMADTLMVSGVGEAAVSSVSLVDSLNILIIQIRPGNRRRGHQQPVPWPARW